MITIGWIVSHWLRDLRTLFTSIYIRGSQKNSKYFFVNFKMSVNKILLHWKIVIIWIKSFSAGFAVLNIFKYSFLLKNNFDYDIEVWDLINPLSIGTLYILLGSLLRSLKAFYFIRFNSWRSSSSNVIIFISCSIKPSNSPWYSHSKLPTSQIASTK